MAALLHCGLPAKPCPGGDGMKMVEPDALLLLLSACFSARFCSSLAADSRSARTFEQGSKWALSKQSTATMRT